MRLSNKIFTMCLSDQRRNIFSKKMKWMGCENCAVNRGQSMNDLCYVPSMKPHSDSCFVGTCRESTW